MGSDTEHAEHIEETVARLLGYVAHVPPDVRVYDITEESAERVFGLRGLLPELRARGLPFESHPDGPRYCFSDIHFLGLRVGKRSTYALAIRLWAKTLEIVADRASVTFRVRVIPHDDAVAGAGVMLTPEGTRDVSIAPGMLATELQIPVVESPNGIPPRVRELLDEVSTLDFFVLPQRTPNRADVVRRIHAGECESISDLLSAEIERLGYEVRIRAGLVLSIPYSITHVWCELRIGDEWIALDPLMLAVMTRFGNLDRRRWPPSHPFSAIYGVQTIQRTSIPEPFLSLTEGTVVTATYVTSLENDAPHPSTAARSVLRT